MGKSSDFHAIFAKRQADGLPFFHDRKPSNISNTCIIVQSCNNDGVKEHLSSLAFALADPSRIRLLGVLRAGEWCGCHLAALLNLTPATVSRHIAILRRAGLVEARKEGRWLHCRLAKPAKGSAEAGLLGWLAEAQKNDPAVAADLARLKTLACCPGDSPC